MQVSSPVKAEKFPLIKFQGAPLIWDTRQPESGEPEWVVIFGDKFSVPEHQEALRRRTHAKTIGPIGSKCDLEVLNPRKFLGEMASLHFGSPSSKMVIVGVTGTNGKTTSICIMGSLAQSIGNTVAVVGTLGVQIWRNEKIILNLETGFTTPEAPTLHSLFSQLLSLGVTHVFMEVSSHALALDRVGGVDFDGGIFTNLSHDHLDFHENMKNYEEAKAKFFREYLSADCFSKESTFDASRKHKFAILNGNDPAGIRILSKLPLGLDTSSFVENKTYKIIRHSLTGIEIEFDHFTLKSNMIGKFNVENVMGSFMALSKIFPARIADLLKSLEACRGVRGRLERAGVGPGFAPSKYVFIDYAHTPDALEKVLATLKGVKADSQKLWVLFGCGGDRDRSKRPIMGKIAQEFADQVVVTSDNPRTENPEKILEEVFSGMDSRKAGTFREVDRKKAIFFAISQLRPDDILVIAGKGHEDYQIVGTEKKHFSDMDVAEQALKNF